MHYFPKRVGLPALLAGLLLATSATAGSKLLRFPHLNGNRLVFVHGGDLWRVSSEGGSATRLTAHPGLELFPRFSPDGRHIAFTGQYDGDEQVYVIPAEGGAPKALTYYPARGPLPARWGYDNQVYGWTPDGSAVLFRSLRDGWDLSDSKLYTVAVNGGLPQALPMPVSGAGALSPDGKKAVYSPLFRDFRTWKRYEGGWAQELYIFDLEKTQVKAITDHPRADRDPMWTPSGIYYNSDRDGHYNLYSYHLENGETRQITHYDQWDVRWPSASKDGRIVFELKGELHIWNPTDGEVRRIEIAVPTDQLAKRPSQIEVGSQIEDFNISPSGKRVLFTARGDIFTVPVKHGLTRNLTNSSNAHDRQPDWSPDGKTIVFISDRTGEEELWLVDQDGDGQATQLTKGNLGRLYGPLWSPDNQRIVYSDKEGKLHVIQVESGKSTEIADESLGRTSDYTWSPGGDHLAFSLTDPNRFNAIYIWSAADGETRRVTGPDFNEYNPAWDPEGNYLYYISDRSFAPQINSFEWNYSVDRESGIYALALRKDVAHPFPTRNDEETGEEDEDESDEKEGKKTSAQKGKKAKGKAKQDAETEEKRLVIDFEGLAQRVARVPLEEDNFFGLSAIEGHLIYGRSGPFYYGRRSDVQPTLYSYNLKKRKADKLASGINGYVISSDGKTMITGQRGSYKHYSLPKGGESKTVATDDLKMMRLPAQEWATIFDEVWRRFRDYFYVANMHGYDWEAIGERYRPLLEHVAHRSDLNYILGEMIAELNVSHAYVSGGDLNLPDRPEAALLGARLEPDPENGWIRFKTILKGQNEENRYRSPLTEIGVNIAEGDYLLAINGQAVKPNSNPYAILRNAGGQPLELVVHSQPQREGSRKVLVKGISSETALRYLDWVLDKRRRVAEATDGKLGYIHIPDMGANGIREFIKWYYGQISKQALVVDVRGNGGGNVSQMIIERLSRKLLGLDYIRAFDTHTTYPSHVFHGPMVCLLNETSASDGDIFPWTFRRAGLGPLIGKRSWGGIIGITNHGPLLDGGSVNVPQFGNASPEGEWVIEGYGVDPDIEIANDPVSVIQGRDPQLERGIEELLKRLKEKPMAIPPRPAPPVKTQ